MEKFIEFLYSRFLLSDGVSIDTRTIRQGNLFFALSGPNFNGNQYASEALEKGASFAVVDDPSYAKGDQYILAKNSLVALQELATFHRSRFRKPVFALTGSNGKTTTKELINRVLARQYDVLATEGNLNNHIGVPLTLLKLHPQVEIAIIEMGASKVGDIAELCGFANPTHGLITNIGHAHTATFGGITGVLRGKSELFDHLRKTAGFPFVNQLDPALQHMTKRFQTCDTYPAADLELVSYAPFISFRLSDTVYESSIYGGYNFQNLAAAVAVGRHFGVPDHKIAEGICAYKPDNLRSQVVKKGEAHVIIDAYNANPDSMRAALDVLSSSKGEKWVILGDMLELEDEAQQHRELGARLHEVGIDKILLVGPLMRFAAESAPGAVHVDQTEELIPLLQGHSVGAATILIKGSRRMKLESLLEYIK